MNMNERPRLTVGAMVFNIKREKILLLKSLKWGGKYIFPCGHVEFGERLEEAVKREVREETGLEVKDLKFLRILEFIKSQEYYDKSLHFVGLQYTCQALGENVITNKEADSYIWVSPSEALREDLESGTLETITSYLSSKRN